jgi:NADPH:quinone reductase-like Zn-dependent oxidoreductase
VAGASGGVGGLAAQLARHRGATVIGVAAERSHEWLRSRGIVPVAYGDGTGDRLKRDAAESGGALSAMIEAAGNGYVALAVELGIAPARIDTIVDDEAAARYGAKTDGSQAAASTEVVEEVAQLITAGEIELPVAAGFPLDQVREAYTLLENDHPPGKIVLIP